MNVLGLDPFVIRELFTKNLLVYVRFDFRINLYYTRLGRKRHITLIEIVECLNKHVFYEQLFLQSFNNLIHRSNVQIFFLHFVSFIFLHFYIISIIILSFFMMYFKLFQFSTNRLFGCFICVETTLVLSCLPSLFLLILTFVLCCCMCFLS